MFARGSLVCEVMSRAVDAEHKAFLERPSSDIKRKLFISRLRAAEDKMSLRHRNNEKLALNARRKQFTCVFIGKELNTPDPGHPRIIIARLETSYDTQRTACPQSLTTALRSFEQDFSTRVGISIGCKALGWCMKNGDQ